MYGLATYGWVRRAVLRNKVSEYEAARFFGLDRGTISKMVRFSGTNEYQAAQLKRIVKAFLGSDRLEIPSLLHSDPLRQRILIALIVQQVLANVSQQNTERLMPVFDEENPIGGATGQMRTWYTT